MTAYAPLQETSRDKVAFEAGTLRLAVGLMSGTSMDGVDAALIRSDGAGRVEPLAFVTQAYDQGFRGELRAILGARGGDAEIARVGEVLTRRHADAVARLLNEAGVRPEAVDVIGFHGHTVLHAPESRRTWQIGDGALLAKMTGIDVVFDFRSADVAAGGQGAPLAPLYHRALAEALPRPLAVLNLGGVGNVTWLGAGEDEVVAFDTGPGNALIDDWVYRHSGESQDTNGALARQGRVDETALARLLDHPYFAAPAPKSLDRDAFAVDAVEGLSPADGAATLTAFTAASVARAVALLPQAPARWLVTGGGRHNLALMAELSRWLDVPVEPVESVGWQGDALEAQAFAYLALRSLDGCPLSLPGTTGVAQATTGGRLDRAG